MEFHENLQSLAAKEGLKGRKVTRALESFSWNITILKVSKNTHTQTKKTTALGADLYSMFCLPRASCSFILPSFISPLCPHFPFLPCTFPFPVSGSGWPAEVCQSWSPREHEADSRCCFDWKPHQGESWSEKSPVPNTTRSGWQTHHDCQRTVCKASKWPTNERGFH